MEIIVEKYNLINKINNKISNKKIKIIRIVYKNILKKFLKISLLKFIIIIIIILFNIFLIKTIYCKKKNLSIDNMKVCLCTLGKNENKYALEYIEHYKKYGVDKIFIYDNNDINGEKFENVLFDYIKNKYVEIINYRGKNKIQLEVLNHCYKNNNKNYDWFLFYDMDEFIFLRNYNNIKFFLINKKFKRCKVIYLNEVIHLDNNQIYYKNKSLSERFTEIKNNSKKNMVKSILRGHLKSINITNNHIIDYNIRSCNGLGKREKIIGIHTNKIDYINYYFDHYYFKSSEEYLDKLRRGSCYWGNLRNISYVWISVYLHNNRITFQKLDYFEKMTKINLSIFRNQIMGNKSLLQTL